MKPNNINQSNAELNRDTKRFARLTNSTTIHAIASKAIKRIRASIQATQSHLRRRGWLSARNPPRLITSQRLGDLSITQVGVTVDISERLPVYIQNLEAAGDTLNGPWWLEAESPA
jgi:hypothetical protein